MAPDPASARTIIEVVRWRAVHEPDRKGYGFLRDGVAESLSVDYASLDRQARTIAVALRRLAKSGDRALLLYPQGLDYIAGFFGCLYAGLIAVPAYPPRANRHGARIQAIAADAQAAVALTTAELMRSGEAQLSQHPACKQIRWLASDELHEETGESWQAPATGEETVAYLQYTSGSTADPKGVVVTHGNLMRNLRDQDRTWAEVQDSVFVTWLPIFHDLGLVFGIVQPLYKGAPCFVMPPASFIQRPVRWLQAMSRYRGTHTGGPCFAYDLCVRKVKPDDAEGLDLTSWRVAVNAAEPVRLETMERFAERFGPYGFRWNTFCPAYGLAETTLEVTLAKSSEAPVWCYLDRAALEQSRVVEASDDPSSRALVGCGAAGPETRIAIVHPERKSECLPDEIGEIWVSSPSNARGYWKRPEQTALDFEAYLAPSGEGPFLRTGDLGFIKNGQVFVAGRLKDVIIVRGQNHYPQDIELTAERSHPALRVGGGAAFSIEVGDTERLVVVQEVERDARDVEPQQLMDAIRQAVAEEHELQVWDVVLLKAGGLLRTSSGKVQRSSCRAAYLAGALELWKGRGAAAAGREAVKES